MIIVLKTMCAKFGWRKIFNANIDGARIRSRRRKTVERAEISAVSECEIEISVLLGEGE